MRRKTPAVPEQVIDPQILEGAKRYLDSEVRKVAPKCTVCGAEASASTSEQLCWVCRRLKISAWRDIETQTPAQE